MTAVQQFCEHVRLMRKAIGNEGMGQNVYKRGQTRHAKALFLGDSGEGPVSGELKSDGASRGVADSHF